MWISIISILVSHIVYNIKHEEFHVWNIYLFTILELKLYNGVPIHVQLKSNDIWRLLEAQHPHLGTIVIPTCT
jgi:hypothetical protein